ncbi:hypothetical protein A9K55_009202 [Cordyceps militaris]|uniref:Uncharacterized protein n=1 Tax=Cordyceps militaris TaxID=73501 RepID=A0A2H4SHF8_CORMI|nr:hypothetical protein A9K55_009202 [Cordyceps militaris]
MSPSSTADPHHVPMPHLTAKMRGHGVVRHKPESARIQAHLLYEGTVWGTAKRALINEMNRIEMEFCSPGGAEDAPALEALELADPDPTPAEADGYKGKQKLRMSAGEFINRYPSKTAVAPYRTTTTPIPPRNEFWAGPVHNTTRQATAEEIGGRKGALLYAVSATVRLLFRDFDRLGAFIQTRIGSPYARLEGPEWEISEPTRARLAAAAARRAFEDAYSQAVVYGDFLGPMRIQPVEIVQDGRDKMVFETDEETEFGPSLLTALTTMGQTPQEARVSVTCDVTFIID